MSDQTRLLNAFTSYFEAHYVEQILSSHLQIIMDRRSKFVGTKTFCSALKTVQVGIKQTRTRKHL